MRRAEYLDVAERLLRHVEAGTTDSAEEVRHVSVSEYIDYTLWQREVDVLFRRLPILLAFSCEMREIGSYKTVDVAERPVLLVRGRDGIIRAFLNVCSHRGAGVAEEGCGVRQRFTCKNHGWTYDDRGRLLAVADRGKFGEIDTTHLGLRELSCAERAGLVFAVLTPGIPIDLEYYLGGMLPELESLGMENWHMYRRCQFESPNWKVSHDGYMETYHLAVMHDKTIGPSSIGNLTTYDAYGPLPSGPHQRLGFARKSIVALTQKPKEEWRTGQGVDFVRSVFPNSLFAVRPDGGLVSQIFPGRTADQSTTLQYHLFPNLPTSPDEQADYDERTDLFLRTVRDEDTKYAFQTQRGLESGAVEAILFGRNELGLHRWHDSIKSYLAAADSR